jgi:hypothetical protein
MPDDNNREDTAASDPGFAPKDLSDNRPLGDWHSRYHADAWRHIWVETIYLFVLLMAVVGSMLAVWLMYPQKHWQLTAQNSLTFSRYALAWLSGTLGGLLFAMKWLYHSVAKQRWNLDRRLWRYLTPHISGGLAFATVAIIQSLGVFDPSLASTPARTTALGFLVGFFSDNALAKLTEIAETIFGPTTRRGNEQEKREKLQRTPKE